MTKLKITTCLLLLGAAILAAQGVSRGVVTGNVTNSRGSALRNVPVLVRVDEAPSYRGTATTDSAGRFTIEEVPEGKLTISANRANGVARHSVITNLTGTGPVNVTIKIPAGQ